MDVPEDFHFRNTFLAIIIKKIYLKRAYGESYRLKARILEDLICCDEGDSTCKEYSDKRIDVAGREDIQL